MNGCPQVFCSCSRCQRFDLSSWVRMPLGLLPNLNLSPIVSGIFCNLCCDLNVTLTSTIKDLNQNVFLIMVRLTPRADEQNVQLWRRNLQNRLGENTPSWHFDKNIWPVHTSMWQNLLCISEGMFEQRTEMWKEESCAHLCPLSNNTMA